MVSDGSVNLELKDNIGTIVFHHPKGNSLPGKLLHELAKTITEAGGNPAVHVVVLKSKGEGAFCAGASFDELIAIEDQEQGKHFFMGFAKVLNAMRRCSKLVIVRVQGKTVGGGVGIAAAGDYTFAHQSASVKLSELALGIGPFVVGPAVQRKIGAAAFGMLSIDAKSWHDAFWANQKGLFAKVITTHEELDQQVEKLAEDLAASSPEAMHALKKMLWQNTDHWGSLLEQRAVMSGKLVLSDYTKDFISDFKRAKK